MTSLSTQQCRDHSDAGLVSFMRQPPHRFPRHHQYYQQQAADNSTIYPIILSRRGTVVSADGSLNSRGGDSFPDYDNLIPCVRLDRIVEDEADREDCSIDNVNYDNAATRGSSDAPAVDKDRVTQEASRDLDGGGCPSSRRCNNSSSYGYHCQQNNICANSAVSGDVPLREFTNKRTMGNVLFASHTGTVGDSSLNNPRTGQVKRSFIGSSNPHTDLGNSATSSPAEFGRDKPSITFAQVSDLSLCSVTSGVSARECVKVNRNQPADLWTQQQGSCSTFTKVVGENASESRENSERNCAFVTKDILLENKKPSRSITETSDTKSVESNSRRTSLKSTFEKDNFIVPKHARSPSSTEECYKPERPVSDTETYPKKLLYDRETCKEVGYHQQIPFGKTPVIVITTSTPKKKASSRTQYPDSHRQGNAVPDRDLQAYNGVEKTTSRKKHTSSLENRHSNDGPKNEVVGSAPLRESGGSYSDLEYIDKNTPESDELYGRTTDIDQHSSYPEHLTDSYTTKDVTLSPKVTDDQNLSEEEPEANTSYSAATTTATPTASTTIATTKERVKASSVIRDSRLQIVEELNLNSCIDRPYEKSNSKSVQEPAVDDSLGDYAVPCEVNRQEAVILSQEGNKDVSRKCPVTNKEKPDHTFREQHNSLIETDSASLSEPQYTEIPEATEPRAAKPSLGRFMVGSDSTHYKVVRLCEPAERRVHASDTDDIYAVPIPKSQRKTDQPSAAMTRSLQLFAEPDSPPKPARSPIYSLESTVFEDTDNPCETPVMRNKVQVTCQMKQSTGRFYSDSSDYDYSNIPKFGRYDFFSLDRQRKRLRGNALRNSKEVSVSLEMLLKLRHESFSEMPVCASSDQTASVDDILRSCREFEQSHAFYRGRTSSDSMQNSYVCSLSFVEMANIKKHIHETKEPENKKLNQLTTFKKNGTENKQTDVLKSNGEPAITSHLQVTKHDASSRSENKVGVQINNTTRIDLARTPFSHDATSSGQNGQMMEPKTMLNDSVNSSYGQQHFASKADVKITTESAQPGFDPSLARKTQTVAYNEEVQNSTFSSDVKYGSPSDHVMNNCDYDCLDTVLSPPAATSPNETSSSFSISRETTSYTDHVATNYQIRSESAGTFYSQRFPVSHSQKPLEVGIQEKSHQSSEENTITREASHHQSPPQSINSPSAEIQYKAVAISEHCQEHGSLQQTTPYISDGALTTTGSPGSPMSSTDVASPVSPVSLWSTSGGELSPGVVSAHSEDAFSESSVGEMQSATQKSSFCNARLEIVEALKWLRAAGFPQYAQMFEDGQFPVDMGIIERDHDFLDQDSLKSLFRRLEKLNKFADLSLDTLPGKKGANEEDEEEDLCALSDRWEYKKSVKRWSRKGVTPSSRHTTAMGSDQNEMTGHSESQDSLLDHDTDSPMDDSTLSEAKLNPLLVSLKQENCSYTSQDKHPENGTSGQSQNDVIISASPTSVASEKNKPSNNVFRKMDVLKSKRSRGMSKRRNIVDISGPIVEDSEHLRAKLERLNCVDISPSTTTLLRREASTGGQMSTRDSRPASADRKGNLRSSEPPTHHISAQSSPHSYIPLQSAPSSHIWVQSQSSSHIKVHTPRSSNIPGQSPHASHIPVQPSPPSNISVQSPLPKHISTQSPSPSHFPPQSSTYSSSKPSLSSPIPNATKPPTPPNSSMLKQSAIDRQVNLSPANHVSTVNDSKLNTQNQNTVTQITNLSPDQRDRPLENAMHDIDTKPISPQVEERLQPGPFPRVLHNDYIQTDSCEADIGATNKHVQYSRTSVIEELKPYPSGRRHRNSVYDNIQSEDRREEQEKGRMIFPGIYELENKDNGNHFKDNSEELVTSRSQSKVEVRQDKLTQDLNSEYHQSGIETVSLDVSVASSSVGSCDQTFGSSVYDRNVSFESSSFQSPGDITPRNETGVSNSETRNDVNPSSESPISMSKGVVHSSSLDSYFQDINVDSNINGREASQSPPRRIAQKEYDDFDFILQQLYQNINELSDYVSRETDTNNSLEFDGTLDLDPENSFSGGEGSNTAESSSEDPELVATDVSRDSLDQIPSISRERRDSGVGHSLPRAPSERRQKKLRWNSFQNSHKPDINCRAMQINHLTVYQMVRLQKLCLLKLTAIMEKCLPVSRSGWNWMMPRFMKKQKMVDFVDRKVFGVPLNVIAQRTGQPLPQCVLYAMRYLRRTSPNAVGIFRKSGVKSKIQQLRDHLEAHPETVNFEGVNAYSVADMLKTYFRDLPECLLTSKMSEIFRSIYLHVPPSQRLEAIQTAIVLLPDENREVLQSILLFLSDISSHAADHQMNANNLAVCFTPTVFQLSPQQTTVQSPKRQHKTSIAVPDPREMMEQKAAHECLLMMILECKKLFTVFPSLYQQLQVHSVPQFMPVPLLDVGCTPSDVRAFGQERIQIILKEAHDKNRGWLQAYTVGDVEVFHRKPMDDCPLKEWKLIVEIEAPPIEVLHRILHERHVWDEDLLSWSVVERLDPHSDIFQFVLNTMAPHPFRHFCVLRYWRSDLNKGACSLITMSVEHSDPMEVQGVWAVDLGSYFLMEHCGSGRSRLTYITRLDTRGRSPEWYTRIFGHTSANFLARLKESFRQVTPGPETRV